MAYLSNTDLTRNDPIFGSPFVGQPADKKTFPDDEQNAYDVYQIVHDELYLDGNARQNRPLSARLLKKKNFTG